MKKELKKELKEGYLLDYCRVTTKKNTYIVYYKEKNSFPTDTRIKIINIKN